MNIICGDKATIDYSLYGWNNQETSYFEDNFKRLSSVVRDTASSVYNNIKNVYNRYHDKDIIRRAKRRLRNMGANVNDDSVIIRTYEPRRANRVMREYIMSNRRVNDMYRRGILDGYSDTDYIHDEVMSKARYELATDGVYNDEGVVTRYWSIDGLDIDEDRLDIDAQQEIAITWDIVSRAINLDIDPTDSM